MTDIRLYADTARDSHRDDVPYFWVNHSHDFSPSDLDFEFNVFCWGCSFDHQSLDAQNRVKKSNIFYDLG